MFGFTFSALPDAGALKTEIPQLKPCCRYVVLSGAGTRIGALSSLRQLVKTHLVEDAAKPSHRLAASATFLIRPELAENKWLTFSFSPSRRFRIHETAELSRCLAYTVLDVTVLLTTVASRRTRANPGPTMREILKSGASASHAEIERRVCSIPHFVVLNAHCYHDGANAR